MGRTLALTVYVSISIIVYNVSGTLYICELNAEVHKWTLIYIYVFIYEENKEGETEAKKERLLEESVGRPVCQKLQ